MGRPILFVRIKAAPTRYEKRPIDIVYILASQSKLRLKDTAHGVDMGCVAGVFKDVEYLWFL